MKPLKIGQVVRVSATSSLDYGWDDKKVDYNIRRVQSWRLFEPRLGIITGKVVKRLGKFVAPRRQYDYETGTGCRGELRVTGTVTLWTVRFGWVNKEMLVLDEYIEATDETFELPHSGRRPHHVPGMYPIEGPGDDKPAPPQLCLPKNSTLLCLTDQRTSRTSLPSP